MADLVASLLDGLTRDFPDWQPGTRPSHTTGIGAIGFFRGTPEAQRFCGAEQFDTNWTPVSIRFSNSKGQPSIDWQPDVRGMAVKFHNGGKVLAEATGPDAARVVRRRIVAEEGRTITETDLVCISTPMFMVEAAEDLLGFERASEPQKVRRRSRIERLKMLLSMIELPRDPAATTSSDEGVLAWAKGYPPSHSFLQTLSTLSWIWSPAKNKLVPANPPVSYARMPYHAVHAFRIVGHEDFVGHDRVKRMVRFTFEPARGVRNESRTDLADDYLRIELKERLANFPTRFNLRMYIADPWDDTSDPTKTWPSNRKRVLMGTLELSHVAEDQAGAGCEGLSFNPGRLVEKYMSMSDDPVLAQRVKVYNESQRRRGAIGCPLTGAVPA